MKRLQRLQGHEWHKRKSYITLVKMYEPTAKGYVCGIYKDKYGNAYSHWLSDKEIDEYMKNSGSVSAETISNDIIHTTTIADWFNQMSSSLGITEECLRGSSDKTLQYTTEYLGEWKGEINMNDAVSIINLWKKRKIEQEDEKFKIAKDELYNNHQYFQDMNNIFSETQDTIMATIDGHITEFADQEEIHKKYEVFANQLANVFKSMIDLTPATVLETEKVLEADSEKVKKAIREKAEAAEASCNICKSKEEYVETLDKYGITKRGMLNV